MAVRSRVLAALALGTGDTTLFEVEADRTAVVRTTVVTNRSAAARNITVKHHRAAGSTLQIRALFALAAGATWVTDNWMVFDPGDSLVITTNGPTVDGIVYGAYLDGAPS